LFNKFFGFIALKAYLVIWLFGFPIFRL
jgi:biotin transporter BioY